MGRTLAALRVCAQKLAMRRKVRVRAVATQACRAAANGREFLDDVRRQTGLAFEIVSPEEEARLSVLGCASLVDPHARTAMVLDIGGGSTELSFIALEGAASPRMLGWTSLDIGVVTLAEKRPEPDDAASADLWWDAMRRDIEERLAVYPAAQAMAAALRDGAGHIVGTSGALSSLGGVHLRLPRYLRSKVDGLWLGAHEVTTVSEAVRAMSKTDRAAHPCIGVERADLIVPGAAIVAAVCDMFPSARVRVADRGLREGVLLELMAEGRT
jgi:exopolyphosphatase/guanosine-5'-triphosphate,3'-diphosphate pyrophosphatase